MECSSALSIKSNRGAWHERKYSHSRREEEVPRVRRNPWYWDDLRLENKKISRLLLHHIRAHSWCGESGSMWKSRQRERSEDHGGFLANVESDFDEKIWQQENKILRVQALKSFLLNHFKSVWRGWRFSSSLTGSVWRALRRGEFTTWWTYKGRRCELKQIKVFKRSALCS